MKLSVVGIFWLVCCLHREKQQESSQQVLWKAGWENRQAAAVNCAYGNLAIGGCSRNPNARQHATVAWTTVCAFCCPAPGCWLVPILPSVWQLEHAQRCLVLGGCELCARRMRAGEGRSAWEAVTEHTEGEGACVNMSSHPLFKRQERAVANYCKCWDQFPFTIATADRIWQIKFSIN